MIPQFFCTLEWNTRDTVSWNTSWKLDQASERWKASGESWRRVELGMVIMINHVATHPLGTPVMSIWIILSKCIWGTTLRDAGMITLYWIPLSLSLVNDAESLIWSKSETDPDKQATELGVEWSFPATAIYQDGAASVYFTFNSHPEKLLRKPAYSVLRWRSSDWRHEWEDHGSVLPPLMNPGSPEVRSSSLYHLLSYTTKGETLKFPEIQFPPLQNKDDAMYHTEILWR